MDKPVTAHASTPSRLEWLKMGYTNEVRRGCVVSGGKVYIPVDVLNKLEKGVGGYLAVRRRAVELSLAAGMEPPKPCGGARVLAFRRVGGLRAAREAPEGDPDPLPRESVHSVAVPGVRRGVPAPRVHSRQGDPEAGGEGGNDLLRGSMLTVEKIGHERAPIRGILCVREEYRKKLLEEGASTLEKASSSARYKAALPRKPKLAGQTQAVYGKCVKIFKKYTCRLINFIIFSF